MMRNVIYGALESFYIFCFADTHLLMAKMINRLLRRYLRGNLLWMVIIAFNNLLEPEFDDISEEAKDFVKKLLTYDSVKRISAADALQHKWIKMHASDDKIEKTLATKTLSNLKNFRVNYCKTLYIFRLI